MNIGKYQRRLKLDDDVPQQVKDHAGLPFQAAYKLQQDWQRQARGLSAAHDYEDVVQQLFLFLFEKLLQKYNPNNRHAASFYTYVMVMFSHHIADILREDRKERGLGEHETWWSLKVLEEWISTDDVLHDDAIKQTDSAIAIDQFVATLTKRQRIICRLLMDGMKQQDIAEELDVSTWVVSVDVKQIRLLYAEYATENGLQLPQLVEDGVEGNEQGEDTGTHSPTSRKAKGVKHAATKQPKASLTVST